MPIEYSEYRLMKEVYHCTPDEFERQDYDTVLTHLSIFIEEQQKKQKEENKIIMRMRSKKKFEEIVIEFLKLILNKIG